MSKSLKQKVDELAERFKVVRGSMNADQFRATVKTAAGYPDESIEVIYDKVFNPPKAPEVASERGVEDREIVATPSPRELAQASVVAGEALSHVTAVHGPPVLVHVHSPAPVPAQVVEYPPRDRLGIATSIASRCQTLALGLVVGILISKPVLKALGY
jgi:hypothetical protein